MYISHIKINKSGVILHCLNVHSLCHIQFVSASVHRPIQICSKNDPSQCLNSTSCISLPAWFANEKVLYKNCCPAHYLEASVSTYMHDHLMLLLKF